MEVWPIGTRCTIGDGVNAYIICISINDSNHIRYQVACWTGAIRNEYWLDAYEIKTDDAKTQRIGFHATIEDTQARVPKS